MDELDKRNVALKLENKKKQQQLCNQNENEMLLRKKIKFLEGANKKTIWAAS